MVEKDSRESKKITELHIRILESLSNRHYVHSNEIYGWVVENLPSPAIFLRYLEELEELGYIQFEIEKGYIRTQLGTEIIKKVREQL